MRKYRVIIKNDGVTTYCIISEEQLKLVKYLYESVIIENYQIIATDNFEDLTINDEE